MRRLHRVREVWRTRGGVVAALALAALVAPAAAGLNEWGHTVDAVLFSRVGTGFGPSAGVNTATVEASASAGGTQADTYVIAPGTNEVSVRAFVTDQFGHRVPGVLVSGTLDVGGRATTLAFKQVTTPDGDLAYDSQRVSYESGDVRGVLWFDFDANGTPDEDPLVLAYREI